MLLMADVMLMTDDDLTCPPGRLAGAVVEAAHVLQGLPWPMCCPVRARRQRR
jgi:hypothetical protein